MSQITTHILDTAAGKPAAGISIKLQEPAGDHWVDRSSGVTNSDGRISNLLNEGEILEPGNYRMVFEVEAYFAARELPNFYPIVTIDFKINSSDHYHIPLLISPFGYSTYRGS